MFVIFLPAILLADNWQPVSTPNNIKPKRLFVCDNGNYIITGHVNKNLGDDFGAYSYKDGLYSNIPFYTYYTQFFNASRNGSYVYKHSWPPYNEATVGVTESGTWSINSSMGLPKELANLGFIFGSTKFYNQAIDPVNNHSKILIASSPSGVIVLDTAVQDIITMYFSDNLNGYYIGQLTNIRYNLYKTTDGGYSWNVVKQFFGETFSAGSSNISFINNYQGYINANNSIYFTNDGGNTWNLTVRSNDRITDAYFVDYNIGYIINDNDLIKTIDHGLTWTLERTIIISPAPIDGYTGHILSGNGNLVMFVSDTLVYRNVVMTGGIINGEINSFSLSQNYPNPFNPTTKIEYSLPKSSKVMIKIYNMSGKEVATLVDSYQTVGNYETTFDGSKLSSGVYFYKLQAGDYVDTKKMMLIK